MRDFLQFAAISTEPTRFEQSHRGLVRTVSRAAGIPVSSEVDNIDDLFPEELRINFYRIVQESLNNIMKHAQATEVVVRIKRSQESMILSIQDNGRGFAPASRSAHAGQNGFGVTGMAERASLLGGEFKLRSGPAAVPDDRGDSFGMRQRWMNESES